MPEEPFDMTEARRLADAAKAVEDEFLDLPEMGRKVDAEIRDAKLAGDKGAKERAYAENSRVADLCARRGQLWTAMADALDAQDIGAFRTTAETIMETAQDEFRRRWSGGGAHRGE
jgi:hypothetical protein